MADWEHGTIILVVIGAPSEHEGTSFFQAHLLKPRATRCARCRGPGGQGAASLRPAQRHNEFKHASGPLFAQAA